MQTRTLNSAHLVDAKTFISSTCSPAQLFVAVFVVVVVVVVVVIVVVVFVASIHSIILRLISERHITSDSHLFVPLTIGDEIFWAEFCVVSVALAFVDVNLTIDCKERYTMINIIHEKNSKIAAEQKQWRERSYGHIGGRKNRRTDKLTNQSIDSC